MSKSSQVKAALATEAFETANVIERHTEPEVGLEAVLETLLDKVDEGGGGMCLALEVLNLIEKTLKERRTERGREERELDAALKALGDITADADEVDLDAAREAKERAARGAMRWDEIQKEKRRLEERVGELKKEVDKLLGIRADLLEEEEDIRRDAGDDTPHRVATQAVRAYEEAVAAQAGAANRAKADDLKRKLSGLEAGSAMITNALSDTAKLRDECLAGADLPVGLTIGDEGELLYKGVPFPEQASGEERITVAVAAAVASDPKLRLLRIADGNRLDSAHMAALQRSLEEHDLMALVELVDESGEVGIVMDNGEVAADNREAK